jgi:Spy/CpxP family protein refolding chaperone
MMKKTVRALVLTMVMACSVQAGWMPNGVTADPPPAPPASSTETTDGHIPNNQPAVEITLNVLGSLLSLF